MGTSSHDKTRHGGGPPERTRDEFVDAHAGSSVGDDALAAPQLPIGTILGGRYRIDGYIGAGGMGTVYRAHDANVSRTVALKVITEGNADDKMIERFRREGRLAAAARNPNIVEIYDLGEIDGSWYMTMELLDGMNLREAMETKGTYTPVEIIPILDQLLAGLETPHRLKLVHRDLKPENVFLARGADGKITVKLLDFGVVKVVDVTAEQQLTTTGTIVGSPKYMPPEQAMARPVDARSDLYAVGCITYAMICGQPPFTDRSIVKLLMLHAMVPPLPPSQSVPDLPAAPQLDAFVLRALEKSPSARYQSAEEMREALSALATALARPDAAADPIVLPEPRAPEAVVIAATQPDVPAAVRENRPPALADATPTTAEILPPQEHGTAPARGRAWLLVALVLLILGCLGLLLARP